MENTVMIIKDLLAILFLTICQVLFARIVLSLGFQRIQIYPTIREEISVLVIMFVIGLFVNSYLWNKDKT